MKKFVFCSKCNSRSEVKRVVLKKFSVIIDQVEPHVCLETPLDFGQFFTPSTTPTFSNNKTVQKSNDLRPGSVGTEDLRDRRSAEHVKDSSAPSSVIDYFKSIKETDNA